MHQIGASWLHFASFRFVCLTVTWKINATCRQRRQRQWWKLWAAIACFSRSFLRCCPPDTPRFSSIFPSIISHPSSILRFVPQVAVVCREQVIFWLKLCVVCCGCDRLVRSLEARGIESITNWSTLHFVEGFENCG